MASNRYIPPGRGPAGSNQPAKPCFAFQKHGTCRFGDSCRYSHHVTRPQGQRAERPRPSPPEGPPAAKNPQPARNGKFHQWKRMLDQGSQTHRPSPPVVSQFFQMARDLMNGDVGLAQEVIKHLASNDGLLFIKDVSDRHLVATSTATPGTCLWTTEIMPLFQLVTHPRVVESAVLEQEVATIFNYLLGVGGARMARLFTYIGRLTQSWPAGTPEVSCVAAVELSLAVLSKILDCNTTNIVNETFSDLVSLFSKCLEGATPQPEDQFSRLQASKYLDYMRRRLEVGSGIIEWQVNPQAQAHREQFVLSRDFPGHLSAQGRRHDNDHAEIDKILILPTYEEIMSLRGEYLPTTDCSQWHIQGIKGRLDREFRLVREDTVGQLRDAVRQAFEQLRAPKPGRVGNPRDGVRTYTYDDALAVSVTFDSFSGLELVVRCSQPAPAQKLNLQRRKDWWTQSKRLQAGALVCAINAFGSVLFGVVSSSTMRTTEEAKDRRNKSKDSNQDRSAAEATTTDLTLSEDPDHMYIKLQLIDASHQEVSQAMRWYRGQGAKSSIRRCLVEFPGVLLASFKHTLQGLQQMYRKPDLPFSNLLAPSNDGPAEIDIQPPMYARKAGFSFDLACLVHGNAGFTVSALRPSNPQELASRSTLDSTQSAALLSTLQRELSLIQGPPGTGKSYTGEKIIKVLLANKERSRIGPILCVCYTNHALDQLLEHLLNDGVEKVIRIGSRSKSERLEGLNLRTVAGKMDRTKSEKYRLYQMVISIKAIVDDMRGLLHELSNTDSWRTIKSFLLTTHPAQHDELFGKEEEGFQLVTHQPERTIDRWLMGGSLDGRPPSDLQPLKRAKLMGMSRAERRAIHGDWMKSIRGPIITQIGKMHQQYTKAAEMQARVRSDVDLRCLQQAAVVGVTTTGLAQKLDLLRRLRCKVMLCEEAGEVLEAHVLTALLPSLEHVILIGDHLQLRPQIQNYDLQSTNPRGLQYSLDMSLFERLVQPTHQSDPRIAFSVLETQRRMHPDISELVRSTLYPCLKDAEAVVKYPMVTGLRDRLFWLHHEELEAAAASQDPLNKSHINEFEVEMTTALVSHLVRQGEYSQGDIAVITPYLGQLHSLRRRMESMFEICLNERDAEELETLEAEHLSAQAPPRSLVKKSTLLKAVRVATVDNFQGEEAKVIVISLVRSNPQEKCGFLSTSNRINVLLSRAQHGMYIIGNSNTYKNVPMWADVIKRLEATSRLGKSLELQCPRHPNARLAVSRPDDFLQHSPESGCILPCDKRLYCGHSCLGRCHSDVLHNAVKCLEKCPRPKKGCEHACPLPCGETCQDKCHVRLDDIDLALPCGHRLSSALCWQAQDPSSIRCLEKVTRTVPGCEHKVRLPCHGDVSVAGFRCPAACGNHRSCGHECKSQCFRCNTREGGEITKQNHGICEVECGRKYTNCPHSCSKPCHGKTSCPPCGKPCEVRCSHSKCGKPCHEPCAPCAEGSCQSRCPHTQCTMPCAAPCDWVPCSRRCEEIMDCGHQCPSLCGEPCPQSKYCHVCASPDVKSTCVDFIEMKEYQDIDLDDEPCIFPDCGHFLTVSSMDGQMDMQAHYDTDANGLPTKIKGLSKPFSMTDIGIKVCPNCRGSLRNISRYGRIVRRAMLDEATKKFITWSNGRSLSLAESLALEHERLEKTPFSKATSSTAHRPPLVVGRIPLLSFLKKLVGKGRYDGIIALRFKIHSYAKEVRKEEQPFHRVADLVWHANRQHRTGQEFMYEESVIQVGGSIVAARLLLKCDVILLSDFLEQRNKWPATQTDIVKLDLSPHRGDCNDLIKLAKSALRPKEAVQGHVFAAQFCALSMALDSRPRGNAAEITTDNDSASESLREEGLNHVAEARALMAEYQATAILKDEVDAAEAMLNDGVYRPVTAEEMRAVHQVMAREFSGTGHWYYCVNNHPFTIGECGMPMQLARCPECGAAIGGQDHTNVDGVRRAVDIEQLATDVGRMGL